MSKIYVFPGQGSQKAGMGKELFDQFPDLVKQADETLGYSIKTLCLEDPEKKLGNTEFTQPALFIVNALTYLNKIKSDGKPDFAAGHSLGEYNALFAAEAFDFAGGIKIVQKRGQIMAKVSDGGMAAIIGMDAAKIKEILQNTAFETIDIANYNSPKQTIISGLKKDIADVKPAFEQAGVKMFIPLKVSGAFHSRYMKEARTEFESFLNQLNFSPLKIPVIANYTAQPYKDNEIKTNLLQQISNSVRWVESIQYLKKQPEPQFAEVGPGKVLTKLIAQIL